VQIGPDVLEVCDINGMTPLHLTCSKQTSQIILYLLSQFPDVSKCHDNKLHLPLHIACEHEMLILVNMAKEVTLCFPEAVAIPDSDGNLPLHIILCNGPTDLDVVTPLTTYFMQALQKHNDMGQVPLHISCQQNSSENVIQYIFQSWRQATPYQI